MKQIIVLVMLGILAGCASLPPPPRIVRVPVPIPCHVTIPPIPILPLSGLKATSSDRAIARAYVESLILIRADDVSVRDLLNACTNPPISGGRS